MKMIVSSPHLILRISAAVFLAAAMTWYSQARAQPSDLQVSMMEEGSLDEPPLFEPTPPLGYWHTVGIKPDLIFQPPSWGVRGPGHASKLENGSGTLVLFQKPSGESTLGVFSRRPLADSRCGKLGLEISSIKAFNHEEAANPWGVLNPASGPSVFSDFNSHGEPLVTLDAIMHTDRQPVAHGASIWRYAAPVPSQIEVNTSKEIGTGPGIMHYDAGRWFRRGRC